MFWIACILSPLGASLVLAVGDAQDAKTVAYLTLATVILGLVGKWLDDRRIERRIVRKVDENTNISQQAFTAANSFNVKLLRLNAIVECLKLDIARRDLPQAARDAEELKQLIADTGQEVLRDKESAATAPAPASPPEPPAKP
jgi:hypothetical protein